ncbi:hypothetical protein D0U04_14655 [Bacillus clarus]|nr:hypothetical protein D0U04_14655 [Bacillus clarus]
MDNLNNSLNQYNQLKIDLLTIVKCIDYCSLAEKEIYQNLALSYSNELKILQNILEKEYNIKFCNCYESNCR